MSSASIFVSSITCALSAAFAPLAAKLAFSGIGGATSRTSRCNVQSPPRSTASGTAGSGTIEPTSLPAPVNANDVT